MIPVQVSVQPQRLVRFLSGLAAKLGRLEPALSRFGDYMTTRSIPANFAAHGRPETWPPVKRQPPIHPLIGKTGELFRRATRYRVDPGPRLLIGPDLPGLPYARIQQKGGWTGRKVGTSMNAAKMSKSLRLMTGAVRVGKGKEARSMAYSTHIPARPYVVVQREDWAELINLLLGELRQVA